MKITCEYCGSIYDDSEECCPGCGAKVTVGRMGNPGPSTIEELQKWYNDRNLPPAEVTRFFIGVDYKLPRAFGIYRNGDEYIVYKNKADGTRAVRYRGTDEAYAVNELYMRLKEEILNQKAHNAAGGTSSDTFQSRPGSKLASLKDKLNKPFNKIAGLAAALTLGGIAFVLIPIALQNDADRIRGAVGALLTAHTVEMIAALLAIAAAYVMAWLVMISTVANDKVNRRRGLFSSILTGIMAMFGLSIVASIGVAITIFAYSGDVRACNAIRDQLKNGYYVGFCEEADDIETLWYRDDDRWRVYYDNDWHSTYDTPYIYHKGELIEFIKFTSVPSANYLGSADKVNTANYGYPPYTESTIYNDSNCSYTRGYYKYDDKVYYCLNESQYSFYEYDEDDDDWRSVSSSSLPVELQHASLAGDFYYTPVWDSQTQISDFEDTPMYQDQIEKESEAAERAAQAAEREQYSSNNDNDYNWDSNDSWDSGGTDWDSDW